MDIIRSKTNNLVKQVKKLQQKKYRTSSYLIEGWHLLEEAMEAGANIEHIFVVEEYFEKVAGLANVSTKKMFGEYCLYLAGKPVALVCDDQLYLKPTSAGRGMVEQVIEGAPYPGAKPHLLITADLWEDRDWLNQLIQATGNELPLLKPKKKNA